MTVRNKYNRPDRDLAIKEITEGRYTVSEILDTNYFGEKVKPGGFEYRRTYKFKYGQVSITSVENPGEQALFCCSTTGPSLYNKAKGESECLSESDWLLKKLIRGTLVKS